LLAGGGRAASFPPAKRQTIYRFSRGTTAARHTLFPVEPHREIQDHMRTGAISAAVTAVLLAASVTASAQVSSGSTNAAQQNAASKPRHETPYSGK
jgi:hypothetical protein